MAKKLQRKSQMGLSKIKPIYKQLEEEFGGKWKYIRTVFGGGIWEQEGSDAYACYVATGGYDINGSYVEPTIHTMYVYGLGTPKRYVPTQSYKKFL